MGRKLRRLAGALKDQASLLRPSSPASAAVLRATSHLRPSSPPHPLHIAALLSFGRGSRPSALSLSSSLSHRLLSARDPSVALKSLLSLHLLLLSAPFILLDSLLSSLLPPRSPLLLLLSSSSPLSSPVRWYSRLLHLRLPLPPISPPAHLPSLPTPHLLSQLHLFLNFLAHASAPPPPDPPRGNRLLAEVHRLVAGDSLAAEDAIRARLAELRLRLRVGSLGFGDAVELVCALRRLADSGASGRFRKEAEEARGLAEELLLKEGRDLRRREPAGGSVSERFGVRTGEEVVLFASNRWV